MIITGKNHLCVKEVQKISEQYYPKANNGNGQKKSPEEKKSHPEFNHYFQKALEKYKK